jgi:LysR family transcriptional regulator, glycine cleavage system transcriptional activator
VEIQARLESGTLLRPFSITATPLHQYHLLPHAQTPAAEAFVAWLRAVSGQAERDTAALLSGSSGQSFSHR